MSYKEELQKLWTKAGGLITKATAAKILGVNQSVITKRIKNGTIKSYIISDDEFLSLGETLSREDIKPRKKRQITNE